MDPRPAALLSSPTASARARRRRRAPLLVLALIAALVVAAPITARPAEALTIPGKTAPTVTVVRGSLEQIYVLNAAPSTSVTATSGAGTKTGTTDADGALLLRNVAAGTYTVTIHTTPVSTFTNVVVDSRLTPQQTIYDNVGTPAPRPVVSKTMKLVADQPVDDFIEVSDGTLLDYRVDLPFARPNSTHRFDVVVLYSGYRAGLRPAESWEEILIGKLLHEGFAVVSINMRGTGCSGGAFDVMEELVGRDGYDAIATINAQPWVDNVAMAGASWLGLSQLFVAQHFAASPTPILDAIAPGASVVDLYRDVVYPGGILNNGFATGWAGGRDSTNAHPSSYGTQTDPTTTDNNPNTTSDVRPERLLDLGSAPTPTDCGRNQALRNENRTTVAEWQAHPSFDGYWQERVANVGAIHVPTLLVGSWQDEQTGSRPAVALEQFGDSRTRMIATDYYHGSYLDRPEVWSEVTTFLDTYLRAAPAAVTAYQSRKKVEVLLETFGGASPLKRLKLDAFNNAEHQRYVLGPDLVPEVGGSEASSFAYSAPVRRWIDPVTADSATFVTAPLNGNVVMAGSGSADLTIRAEQPRVDLQVTLSEVRTDGQEMLIQSGWLRASQRQEGPGSTVLRPVHTHVPSCPAPSCGAGLQPELTPGTWTPVRVELLPFAHVFRSGSRIKLTVDGPDGAQQGDSWNFATDPNIGTPERPSHVSIKHGPAGESSFVLPVRSAYTVDPLPAQAPCVGYLWYHCRATPSIQSFTASVGAGNLVTLTAASTGAYWNLAVIEGPKYLGTGGTGDVGLALANGSTAAFEAPPGRHRYTLHVSNTGGVSASKTIEVDVPGINGADPLVLAAPPTTPLNISWSSPGTSWWASIDGAGLHGWVPLTQSNVNIPAASLPTGIHTVRLTSCTASGCSSQHKPVTLVAGTVKWVAPTSTPANPFGGKLATGIRDDSSLLAVIQPTGGGPLVRVYSPYPGIFASTSLTVNGSVTAGQELGVVQLLESTQESLKIDVG